MKKIFNNCINFFKNTWKNDYKDILVPAISLLIFIIAIFAIGIIGAIVALVLINAVYFTIIYIKRRKRVKKGNEKEMKKKTIVKKKEKSKVRKILKILLILFLTFFILGIIAVVAFLSYIVVNAPEFNEDNLYVSEPSIVLDKDGNEIAKLGSEKRIMITYDEIPEVLIDAIIATEDSRFFEHKGVDWARFIKASIYQVLGKSEAGGASTLTMQVSKNAYTDTVDTGIEGIIRKFTDVYVSTFVIEKNYTKEQIMEFYVNSQWLAKHTYGVEQTALTYFGKSAKELNVSEAAMIAGLFQAPGRYDPYKNPEATEARRIRVLKLMLRHGYIDQNEYDIAKKLTVDKIVIPKEQSIYSSGEVSEYQSFIDTVVDEIKEKTGKNPYNTSMIIYTTLDTDYQNYINSIMNGEAYDWDDEYAQAGIAVVNVKDGSIAAIGGGRNVDIIDSWNYATEIENQIGSTAKPLYDYGPAIEYNSWSSYHILVDEPTTYSNGKPINNWDRDYEGLETARNALKGSRNIPALKTFRAINQSNIIDFVTSLGLTPEIYTCPSGYTRKKDTCINIEDITDVISATKDSTLHEAHAIGGYNGESPLTMAAAYAAFANKGVYNEPYSFTKVVFIDSGEEYINTHNSKKVMSEETAYIISDMLVTTGQYALGKYNNINGREFAAKTGTTNYDAKALEAHNMPSDAINDYWCIGYNTEYAIGVWYGYDEINNEHYNSIKKAPHTRLFQAVGKKVFSSTEKFTKPSGVVEVEVELDCVEATLPSEFTPQELRKTEVFIKGTEPTTVSQRFARLNNVTNLTATVEDGNVTLNWKGVKTPEFNTEEYIYNYYKPIFTSQEFLDSQVQARLEYVERLMGNIEYEIYLEDEEENLTLLTVTAANTYETTLDVSGDYTFVVKTVYSIFKDNRSTGQSVTATVNVTNPLIPDPDPNEDPNNDSNENSGENNNNNNGNNNQSNNP